MLAVKEALILEVAGKAFFIFRRGRGEGMARHDAMKGSGALMEMEIADWLCLINFKVQCTLALREKVGRDFCHLSLVYLY